MLGIGSLQGSTENAASPGHQCPFNVDVFAIAISVWPVVVEHVPLIRIAEPTYLPTT